MSAAEAGAPSDAQTGERPGQLRATWLPQPPIIALPAATRSSAWTGERARGLGVYSCRSGACPGPIHIQEVKPMGFFTSRAALLSMFVPVAVALAGCSQP